MTPVTRHLCRAALLAAVCVAGGAASFALGPAAAATSLSLATSSRNACSPSTLTAPTGTTTLSFTNTTDDWQSFGVLGVGGGSPDRVREGGTSTLTATLAAGTYTYWCGDDQSKAMRGTLTVTAAASPPGSTAPSPPPPAGLSITTSDNAFSTTTLAADAGTITITVTNAGRDAHTFTIGGLVNVVVSPGQTKTQTFFANPGTYTFVCAYHGEMRGTLTVRQGAGPSPPPPPPPPPAPPGGGPASVTITEFAFNPGSVSVPAGPVTLTIANAGVVPHTFTIDGLVNASVAPGQTTTVSFTAADGTYRIYCSVSGHVKLGMTGTLVVGTGGSGSAPPPAAPPKPPAPPEPAPPGAAALTITDFAFSPGSLTVPAGNVTLAVTNAGQLPHTFTIDGLVNVDLAPGQSTTVGFAAPVGSHRFYCAVAGHVSLGMTGTLIAVAEDGAAPPPQPPPPVTHAEPPADGGHAGHQSAGTTETPQQLARGCRPRATIVLRGRVVSASPRQLRLAVTRTNRAGRAYATKRAELLLHTKTVFGRVGAAALHGLAPGDSVTVSAGRCRAYGRRLVAMRVDLSATAPVDTGGGTTLRLTADAKGFPRFDKKSLESPAGNVTLTLTNPSPLPHNISIEGVATGKQVVNGGTSTVTAVLRPGSYTYLCTVPGHAQAGMKGTLVVR